MAPTGRMAEVSRQRKKKCVMKFVGVSPSVLVSPKWLACPTNARKESMREAGDSISLLMRASRVDFITFAI